MKGHASQILLCLTLLAALPAAAWGAAPQETDPCDQATSTSAMAECRDMQAKHWDQRLNKAYQTLQRDVAPAQRKPLQAAQRLWIKYRDANCGFYAAGDGSIARVLAADCVQSMTKQRACELEVAGGPQQASGPQCQ